MPPQSGGMEISMKICDETDGEGNSMNSIMSIDLIGTWELPSPVKNDPWV